MKYFFCLLICFSAAFAQTLQNPVLFVTAVPTPYDSLTQTAAFGSHQGSTRYAPRGGDLWIRYPDGTTKNLTQLCGYGQSGQQGVTSIAVREPSMHWSGTKAVFSMVVGAPTVKGDTTRFVWQLYEISALGKTETPVITKVNAQPTQYNNLSPIYGTDDRIIFTSDKPRGGMSHLYPRLDEYKTAPTNTGLWSLDTQSSDLMQLDDAVSGDFSPFMDSYGRLLFIRWDHLQRDHNADVDIMQSGSYGSFNYTDESLSGTPRFQVRDEVFPEPQGIRTDILAGTNMNGFEFNTFLPWQINEDGSNAEVMNHLGRHDFRQIFGPSIKDDPQVTQFNMTSPARTNQNPIGNIMQLREDPNNRGMYFAVDANQNQTHGGGQVIRFNAAPNLDPNQTVVNYITHRSTSFYTLEGNTPNTNHSGFYRTPLPTTDGKLLSSHSTDTHADKNIGSATSPLSRYDFRIKFLTQSGSVMIAGTPLLSAAITKQVSYWNPDTLISYNGQLWELDPVEVVARQRPTKRSYTLADPELNVFNEEKIDTAKFRQYLRSKNLAVIVSRDVTVRDRFDKQQPYNLRVAGTTHAHNNGGSGKVYDVAFMQMLQSDHIRGYGMTTSTSIPKPGRRVIAQPLHDVQNSTDASVPTGSVRIASDGSYAAYVPAQRAMTWQLLGTDAKPIVRERYWVTFKSGEIRSCAMCHGTNSESAIPQDSVPTNKPEALRGLLQNWRLNNLPAQVQLQKPDDGSTSLTFPINLKWQSVALATQYTVVITTVINGTPQNISRTVAAPTTTLSLQSTDVPVGAKGFTWNVIANGTWGDALASSTWRFATGTTIPSVVELSLPLNKSTGILDSVQLKWKTVTGASSYVLQVSTKPDLSSPLVYSQLTQTQYMLKGIVDSTTYFWKVTAMLAGPDSAMSELWTFSTSKHQSVLAAAMLVSPPDGSKNQAIPVEVSWTHPMGATKYTVQIATKSDFSDAQSGDCPASPVRFSALQSATTYFWRVQAKNASSTAAWSEVWSFTTAGTSDAHESSNNQGLDLLPTPTQDVAMLHVHGQDAGTSYEYRILSLNGEELVQSHGILLSDHETIPIQCSSLMSGSYLLQFKTQRGLSTLRFIVMH